MVLGWDETEFGNYDVLCNHLLYSEQGVKQILGDEKVFKFSILREPTAQYRSVFR